LKSSVELEKLGNLRPDEIRLLLQLNLRIRNNDQMLVDFMHRAKSLSNEDFYKVKGRVTYCIKTAENLLNSICSNREELRLSFEALKKEIEFYIKCDDQRV